MGGATLGPNDELGPGTCDIQKIREEYCPTPCEEWCDYEEWFVSVPTDKILVSTKKSAAAKKKPGRLK